ncbi:DNA polymerase III subunit gamma and tau [Saccharomonospora piscinae]|uniref:DNA polymerase III subunit gamma and tau n=1 Tax=Saccharomonospora piscinae TaxID=687388 RepID=UPI001106D743|nr:DNA polymerase III subunit gamma and tau [Saccharomonospora piscinae]TLW93063.1 DNA polymerase III subunit gamma and tau [Saccharomonospora piscinae]
MALALYRKYRPATFAEVVGQEHVTEPLRTTLASGRINHAYLFSGPRGCGKTSSARIMARSLNCVQGPTPDPCGECGPCRALAPEGPGSVDVTELDAASHGGVDDARELRDRAFYAPAESRYRVFIIDEAHMVTPQGFNALLKIVEEPPDHLIFIFATTEPDKVLTTIRSRTHHYPFRLIPPSAMRELLERNVAAEGIAVEQAVYPLVIRAGGGSARDTQSVLDQLLAGAGPDGVTYDRAAALLGVTDVALLDAMVDALATDDSATVYGTVDHLAEAGHDPRRFATDLLDRLRDLILLRAVPDAADRGMVAAPEEQVERMVGQAQRLAPGTLTRYAEILHNGLLEMRGTTSPRLVLELLCSRMLLPEVADDEGATLQRLERLERRVTAGAPSAPSAPSTQESSPQAAPAAQAPAPERVYERPSQRAAPQRPVPESEPQRAAPRETRAETPATPPTAPATPAPSSAEPAEPTEQAAPPQAGAEPSQVDAAGLRQYWPQVLAAVRTRSRSTEALLTGATVHSVSGATVVLTHPAEPLVRRLSEKRNVECIAAALGEVVSGEWTVRCVHPSAVQAAENAGNTGNTGNSPGSGPPSAPQQNGRGRQEPPARTFQRPTRQGGDAPSRAVATGEPDIPLPPEPDPDEPDVRADPGAVMSDAPPGTGPVDAESRAQQLLSEHLGARRLG